MTPAPKTILPCRPKWKSAMTDRQRFNNQMHYKPVDASQFSQYDRFGNRNDQVARE